MKCLITGICGQDGSYLAELLLKKGYEVHGFMRRFDSKENLSEIIPQLHLHSDADMIDERSMRDVIKEVRPDEIYHLAAQSVVWHSFNAPLLSAEVTGLGTLRLLEAVRELGLKPRIYNAASSEMFGGGEALTEESPFNPRSPYGAAKLFSYNAIKIYRNAYGIPGSNGILFNHESPRRGSQFLTRTVSRGIGEIVRGERRQLTLGNLSAVRDWGYAPEFVEAMWHILQLDEPIDLVVGTGEPHSVKDFVEEAFHVAGLEPNYVSVPQKMRPWDVECIWSNPAKAKKLIGWEPKVRFMDLVKIMVEEELKVPA